MTSSWEVGRASGSDRDLFSGASARFDFPFLVKKDREPCLAQAEQGQRAVFFVDAAHFVLGALMSVVWCLTRVWIRAPSGKQRFNVL